MIAAGVVAAFLLFATRPDVLNCWLAELTAIAGVMATLTNLLGVFRGGRGATDARQ